MIIQRILNICLITLLLCVCPGCGDSRARTSSPESENITKTLSPVNGPLEPYQDELLTLAFSTATGIPVEPHIKDRSKFQQLVADTCLKLDQPVRAENYIKDIDNWRRGAALADLASYYADKGFHKEAKPCLDKAADIAETSQDWRKDNIKIRIASVYTKLGLQNMAATYEDGVDAAESGKMAATRAGLCDDEMSYDRQMAEISAMAATGNFDAARNALFACVELYDRFYDDKSKRDSLEQKIRLSWGKLPYLLRINILKGLAEKALAHNDSDKAIELLDDTRDMLVGSKWPLRYSIPLKAGLAELRYRCGDVKNARRQMDAAFELYKTDGKKIVNIYRADTLCPLAEAFHKIGNTAAALEVYALATEESVENPNSRPRAENITAICCSMALVALEPDAGLWRRIRGISEGLGSPW